MCYFVGVLFFWGGMLDKFVELVTALIPFSCSFGCLRCELDDGSWDDWMMWPGLFSTGSFPSWTAAGQSSLKFLMDIRC